MNGVSLCQLQWVGLYLVVSALAGLSVTYYYDDPHNAKLNTILERGLQLGGLALVRKMLPNDRTITELEVLCPTSAVC